MAQENLHWHDAETGEKVPSREVTDVTGKQLCGVLNFLQITQRNKFCVGDHVEIMKRDGRDLSVLVGAIYNEEMEPMESAPHAKQKLWVWLIDDNTYEEVDVENGDILRMNAEA